MIKDILFLLICFGLIFICFYGIWYTRQPYEIPYTLPIFQNILYRGEPCDPEEFTKLLDEYSMCNPTIPNECEIGRQKWAEFDSQNNLKGYCGDDGKRIGRPD